MLRSAAGMRGHRIEATDGEIGKVQDVLFDDLHWGVRYLVVDTGTWLPGRQVLVSPAAVRTPDWERHVVPVELTQQQVEASPELVADEPVSRQREKEVVKYFQWPIYWAPAAYTFGSVASGSPPPPVATEVTESAEAGKSELSGDPNLRSVREVTGYHVGAQDGDIGHVEDFVVDTDAWAVRYVVVDTRNWLPGRKVILAPDWFSRLDWEASKAFTDLTQEAIEKAPPYDPNASVDRDYEGRLYDHYGRPGYWTEAPSPAATWKV